MKLRETIDYDEKTITINVSKKYGYRQNIEYLDYGENDDHCWYTIDLSIINEITDTDTLSLLCCSLLWIDDDNVGEIDELKCRIDELNDHIDELNKQINK